LMWCIRPQRNKDSTSRDFSVRVEIRYTLHNRGGQIYNRPTHFFRGAECPPMKMKHSKMKPSLIDDQVRSQSTKISVSVNAIETKSNSLESA
jgi:hypothetical protein